MRKSAAERAPEAHSGSQQKFWTDGAFCPSHHRGSRRRRLLADRARRRSRHPSRHRGRRRDRRCRYRRSRTRGHADRRRRHSHAEQQLARHRQADQRAVVSGAAADRRRRPDDAPRMLGDIAIAYETTRREADDEAKAVRSSSQPSGGPRFPASDRLRSRKRRRRRSHGNLERRFWRNSAFPIPMRTGSGWTEMAGLRTDPRQSAQHAQPAGGGAGRRGAAPGRRQLADARDPHAVRLEAGIGPRRSAGRARCLDAGRGRLFRHRAHHAAQYPRPA